MMFAVVNHLHLTIPVDQIRASLEQDGLPLLTGQPGFRGFNLVKAGETHAIAVMFWDSAADARNGTTQFGPLWFDQHVAPYLSGDQQLSFGEIIVKSDP